MDLFGIVVAPGARPLEALALPFLPRPLGLTLGMVGVIATLPGIGFAALLLMLGADGLEESDLLVTLAVVARSSR